MPIKTNKKILIIDDDENIIKMLELVLKPYGVEIDNAKSGSEGIRRAKEIKPDLITLDIRMPGIGGLEALKKLKNDEETKNIPIIVVSADADRFKKECVSIGAYCVLNKPFDFNQFRTIIKNILII